MANYEAWVESVLGRVALADGSDCHSRALGVVAKAAAEGSSELRQVTSDLLAERSSFERELWKRRGSELISLDDTLGSLRAVLNLVTQDADVPTPPPSIHYAIVSIGTRALKVGYECHALLKCGFAVGALARWRTLSELSVVARVLALGNRHTAARFNQHRWIMLARDRDHVEGFDQWNPPNPSPELMRKRLVKRYGTAYSGRYGWAAELSKRKLGVRSPQWHHLERMAQMSDELSGVDRAHHAVHADSLGMIQIVDSRDLWHAGASEEGVAQGAARFCST